MAGHQQSGVSGEQPSREGQASAREHLKNATHDLHERIDRHTTSKIEEAATPEAALSAYTELLLTNLAIWRAIEGPAYSGEIGRQLKELGADLDSFRKSSLIESDLKALGLSDADISARLPELRYEDTPTIENVAQAAGVIYVLEGSTIGAPVRQAVVNKKVWGGDGSHPFNLYGAHGEFREALTRFTSEVAPLLETLLPSGAERNEAVRASREAFEAFAKLLKL